MKKAIVFLAAVALTVSASAQNFSYGLKGGLNLSTISKAEGAKMKPSIYAGAFAEYKFNDYFGISPELIYSRQGTTTSIKDEFEDMKSQVRLNYINVPVLAKIYLADALSLDLGPQVGFLIGAKSYAKGTIEGEKVDGTTDVKKAFQSVDFSFGMGLTYNIGKFLVQARYNLGLTDTAKYADGEEKSKDKYRNNVIQVGVGYRF